MAMARRGLRLELRSALNEAVETRRSQIRAGLTIDVDERAQTVDMTIEPLPEIDGEPPFLIVFTDVGTPRGPGEEQSGR